MYVTWKYVRNCLPMLWFLPCCCHGSCICSFFSCKCIAGTYHTISRRRRPFKWMLAIRHHWVSTLPICPAMLWFFSDRNRHKNVTHSGPDVHLEWTSALTWSFSPWRGDFTKFTWVLQINVMALKMAAGIPPRGSERGHVMGLLKGRASH